jgi:hypothetical protein
MFSPAYTVTFEGDAAEMTFDISKVEIVDASSRMMSRSMSHLSRSHLNQMSGPSRITSRLSQMSHLNRTTSLLSRIRTLQKTTLALPPRSWNLRKKLTTSLPSNVIKGAV